MAAATPEELLDRARKPRLERDQFMALMRDAYGFAMPERDGWTSYGVGQNRSTKVYDGTAIASVPRFANRLQQALLPPNQRWAKLAVAPGIIPPDRLAASDLPEDLEAATELMFGHVRVSNFDTAANEWAQDLSSGTACMLLENGRDHGRPTAPLFRARAIPSNLVAFDEGPDGSVEGIFFDQAIKGRSLQRTYPDARLPPELAQLAAEKPEDDIALLQATVYDPESDRWHLHLIHEGRKERLLQRTYLTSPWIITRWSKAPGETRGRGPLTMALPDIRTINKVKELILRKAALEISGVFTGRDDGVLNPSAVRLVPGAIIPVQSNGGNMGPSLARLDMGGPLNLTQLILPEMQTAIRQALFDNPLPPEIEAGLTATEIVERVRQFQQDTGAFGRLQAEAVIPIVRRLIDIMEEAGELADPRFAGIGKLVTGGSIRIVPESPLAQVQNRADVSAIQDFARMCEALGPQLGPQVLQTGLKIDEVAPYVAEKIGVPAHLIPSKADQAAAQQAAQQQATQQQMLASPAVAQVAGHLARGAVEAAAPAPSAAA